MADTLPVDSTSHSATVSERAAAPRTTTATGRSHLSEFGATLAAQGTITQNENESQYPLTVHNLNVANLLGMFRFIIGHLVWTFTRELGYADPTALNSRAALVAIIDSVAYAALQAAYAVCFNKARAVNSYVVGTMPIPPVASETFPVLITALINSLGPYQSDAYPSRRMHIPILDYNLVSAARPANFGAHLVNLFKEKVQRTRILLTNVELLGTKSVPWWSLFPVNIRATTTNDHTQLDQRALHTKRVFCPALYEKIEPFFKASLVFAPGPLVSPGLGSYSATNWYPVDELINLVNGRPIFLSFPADTRTAPVFWQSCSAFHYVIEEKIAQYDTTYHYVSEDGTITQPPASASGSRLRQGKRPASETVPAGATREIIKRIRTNTIGESSVSVDPTFAPVSPTTAANVEQEDTTIKMYRIVYYYFDHIAISEATPADYIIWVSNFCQAI